MSSKKTPIKGEEVNIAKFSNDEIVALIKRIKKGDKEAEDIILNGYYPLVASITLKYIKNGTEFQDLIQEGNIGLRNAIKSFNHEKGVLFSTYAHILIEQMIKKYLFIESESRRLTKKELSINKKIEKARNELLLKEGKNPSDEEVVKYLNNDEIDLKVIRQIDYKYSLFFAQNFNLESKKCKNVIISSEYFELNEDYETVKKVMEERLTPIEIDVIKKRHGFEQFEPRSLKEIGEEYNISNERVRQIHATALYKLERYFTGEN